MSPEKYFAPLIRSMRQNGNPEDALMMAKYMKNQFDFFGLKQGPRSIVCKAFLSENELPEYEYLTEYIRYLWEQPQRELQYFAMGLVDKYMKKAGEEIIDLIEYLVTNKSWWDTVDYIAAWLAGKYFEKFPERIQSITREWMNSGNFWLQRSALLFQLKYKGKTNFELLTTYINELGPQKEFFIRKAIGWSLREYSKTNANAVVEFVEKADISNFSKTEALKWLKRREAK